MDNKDNKLAVEKIAKKLDKFKLDEVVMILELEENEVKNILDRFRYGQRWKNYQKRTS